jgi:hypothetical protein
MKWVVFYALAAFFASGKQQGVIVYIPFNNKHTHNTQ